MQSMTGYGRCRVCEDGREMTLELKAVNHRFLDISFRIPKNLAFLEDALRTKINQSELRRGHLDLFITYQNTRTDAREIRIDETLLEAFNNALNNVQNKLDGFQSATAAEVLNLSGALSIAQAEEDTEAVTALATKAFDEALEALVAMRNQEGAHLATDLLSNLHELSVLREQIAMRAPSVPEEYRARLIARLEEWQINADPQRIAQEVAIMADRCAIDEELSRLEGHILQFVATVRNGSEVGRKLDFLLQEMNREINTTGSKASDAQITQAVVDAKCIIEKLREQVQNAV